MDIIGAAAKRRHDEDDLPAGRSASGSKFDVTGAHYHEIDVRWDRADGILWCDMAPTGRPAYTHELMAEIATVQAGVRRMFAEAPPRSPPFLYFVCGSKTPGIYNLGGDLAHFIDRIRAGDLPAMRRYAHTCVERQFDNQRAFGAPVITMALVQGDALGGGFEHALAFDIIVAERSAKMGLPEVLFNLFPGMGAYSFISRKLDRRRAEQFILSGRVYTGAELHEMGLVDVLAEDGEGERTLREYVAQTRRRFNMQHAVYEARRRVNPVTLDEMLAITDLWAETAMQVEERDLKVMARLTAAQDRRVATLRAPMRVV